MTAISQVSQTKQLFDRDLSLHIDAILKAIGTVQAWPDGNAKQACLAVLETRRRELLRDVPV